MVVNSFITKLNKIGFYIQIYADDIVVLINGNVLRDLIIRALRIGVGRMV